MSTRGRIFEYFKVRSFEVMCTEIVPVEIPIYYNKKCIVTSKWIDFIMWQEIYDLINKIISECSQNDINKDFELKEGSSVIIGYHFQAYKPSSGIYLTPRDDDDIHNNMLHVEDKAFVYYKECPISLVVSIYPKKLNCPEIKLPAYCFQGPSLIEKLLMDLMKKNAAMWTLNKAAKKKLVSDGVYESERMCSTTSFEADCELSSSDAAYRDIIINSSIKEEADDEFSFEVKNETCIITSAIKISNYEPMEDTEDSFIQHAELPTICSDPCGRIIDSSIKNEDDTSNETRSKYFLSPDKNLIKDEPLEESCDDLKNIIYSELLNKKKDSPQRCESPKFRTVKNKKSYASSYKTRESRETSKHGKSNTDVSSKGQKKITSFFNKSKDIFSDSPDSGDFASLQTLKLSLKSKKRKQCSENEKSEIKNSRICKKDKMDIKRSRKSSNTSLRRRSSRRKTSNESLSDIRMVEGRGSSCKDKVVNKINTRMTEHLNADTNSIGSIDVDQNVNIVNNTKDLSHLFDHCSESPLPIFNDDDISQDQTSVRNNLVNSFNNQDGTSMSSSVTSSTPFVSNDVIDDSLPDLNVSFSPNSSNFVDTKDELPDLMMTQNYSDTSPTPFNCSRYSQPELPDLMMSQNWSQETSENGFDCNDSQDDFIPKRKKINKVRKNLFNNKIKKSVSKTKPKNPIPKTKPKKSISKTNPKKSISKTKPKKSISKTKPKISRKSEHKSKSTCDSDSSCSSSLPIKSKLKEDQNKKITKKYPPNFFNSLIEYSNRVLNPDWKLLWKDEDNKNHSSSTGDYEEIFIKRVYDELRNLTFRDFKSHLEESLPYFTEMILGNTDNERDKKLLRGQNYQRNIDSETFVCILDDNLCTNLCDLFSSHFEELMNEANRNIPVVVYNYLVILPELLKRILMSLPLVKERGITTDDQCEEVCYQLNMYGAKNSP